MITTAGGMLLKGIGVSSNAVLSKNRDSDDPSTQNKNKWPTRMNDFFKISEWRNCTPTKPEKMSYR